jgi:hypothetical protein
MTTNDPNKEGNQMKQITMTAFAAGLGLTGAWRRRRTR